MTKMTKKIRTLLALGVVTVATASTVVPVNALSKATCKNQPVKGAIYVYINGVKYELPMNSGCPNKPCVPADKPAAPADKPAAPADKPATPADNQLLQLIPAAPANQLLQLINQLLQLINQLLQLISQLLQLINQLLQLEISQLSKKKLLI